MTFTVPLTFYNTACLDGQGSSSSTVFNAIESTLLQSKQTAFKAWVSNRDENGLAIGCEDGTVYLFRGRADEEVHMEKPVEKPVEKRKRRSQSRIQLRPSRPASPGLPNPLSPTFAVAPRAQVVLGVSTEQVQAPRNYVDFDDEPERLKDILKGKNPRERERISSDSVSLVTITPAPSTILESPSKVHRKASSARSLLSVDSSSRPQSPSLPPSPTTKGSEAVYSLSLQCHILPTHAGHGHAVRYIEVLEGGSLLIALHESGYLAIYSSRDGDCLISTDVSEHCGDHDSRAIWSWCSLQVAVVDEVHVLLVTAATDSNTSAATPDMDENSAEVSLTVALKISYTTDDICIESLAHWNVEGPAKGVGVHRERDGSSTLFTINSQGHLLLRTIRLPASPSISSSDTPPVAETDSFPTLAIPLSRSFKSIVARSADTLSVNQSAATPPRPPQIIADEALDVGSLISDSTVTGLSTRSVDGKLYGILWAHHEMTVFECHSFKLRILVQAQVVDLENVEWLDDETYALSYHGHVDVYQLQCTNTGGDHVHRGLADHEGSHYSPSRIRQISTGPHCASAFSHSADFISSRVDHHGRLQIISHKVVFDADEKKSADGPGLLWQSSDRKRSAVSPVIQTSSVPYDLETIIQGFSDGRIRQFSPEQMAFHSPQSSSATKQSEPRVPGAIVGLHITLNTRTKEKYVLGGADDGSILFWSLSTFELCARWIVFSTPLTRAVEFQESAGPLRGCVLCIAQDGTVAVIAVDGFQFLYLIPGAPSPLERVSLGDSNLVLIYGGNLARLWDVRTKEFWRSTTIDKAEEMFKQGGWTSLDIVSGVSSSASLWTSVAPAFDGTDAAATLEFGLDRFVAECIALTKTISTSRDEVQGVLRVLDQLRYFLSIVVTPGLNSDVDSICTGKLHLRHSSVGVGLTSRGTATLYPATRPQDAWTISGNVSATRMLSIVYALRAMGLFEELSEAANTVIAFYTMSLPACVGPQFAHPSLEWLGKKWFAAANDLRQSIRTVFDATLAQLNDQGAMALAEKWQQYLPSLLPLAERESEKAALALMICGSVATEKFTLLSVSALTDISKSLTLYLHDEKSIHRALAIELCSKGFHVWQHYVDTMEILRALFNLATAVRKDSISPQNLGAQARLAVINIATNHTPLFMSTLCLDVLSPPTLDHRRSVMQIIAFLIRKRRYILQPNLPRLMEAVVKSLDPNSNADRDAVLATATEIIAFVVKNFPSVDFHMNSQRLAVGTNEGAVVMYDLKTAIRLYVLEGHKRQLTACSFSPDGRRLVTLSLTEQAVLVWKVGSSFSSFFNPGAPPRQGHGGSEPFKTLNFNIGPEAVMSVEDTLDLVKFEWVADRSVKVKIRDSILTFST